MSMGRSSRKASSTYPGECPKWPRSVGDRRSRPVLYPPRVKGFGKEGKGTVRDDQTVAEMANEVLLRQAKARADRSGEPIEEAMEAAVNTEAGRQLRELRDGPHGDEGVEEWQGRWLWRGREPGSGQNSWASTSRSPRSIPRTVEDRTSENPSQRSSENSPSTH